MNTNIFVLFQGGTSGVFATEGSKVLGDVNCDGVMDITDATDVQLYVAQTAIAMSKVEAEEWDMSLEVADVNRDGVVDITDATWIQLMIAKATQEEPTTSPSEPVATPTEPATEPATEATPTEPATEPATEATPTEPATEPATEATPTEPATEPATEPVVATVYTVMGSRSDILGFFPEADIFGTMNDAANTANETAPT